MNRGRLAGMLVVVAVVLGVVLITRIDGVRVAGTAIPVPGAGAPNVGDCLIGVSGSLTVPLRAAFPPSSMAVASVGEPSVSYSDCTGEHVGEVVAFRLSPESAGESSGESDTEWCQQVGAGYQSMTTWRFYGASGGLWQPSTNQRFVAILSAPAEKSWGACAVLAPGLELYSGSYVRSMADLPAPAPFGLCRSGDGADRWVSCTSPHRVQEFGTAVSAGMSSREAVEACRSLIQEMTGLRDVNGGGVLRIQVVGGGSPAGGRGSGVTAASDGSGIAPSDDAAAGRCRLSVVGPKQLDGTLIGIGNHELPLS